MKKPSVMTVIVYGLPILLVAGVIWAAVVASQAPSTPSESARSTRDVAMSCTLDMYTTFHIHPNLTIKINGVEEIIPANVGITNGCMHPLHTHDATGKIHIESPEQRDFTLGDFFAVWGKPFDATHLLDQTADDTHVIVMTVNGATNTDFENYVMRDDDEIVLSYETK